MQLEVFIAIGAAGLFILVLIVVIACVCRRNRRDYELLPERGDAIKYEDARIELTRRIEKATMDARFYLRSCRHNLDRHLVDIGNRAGKQFFLGTSQDAGSATRMLVMVPRPAGWPIPLNTEAGKLTFCKLVKSVEEHPYIATPITVDYLIERDMAVTLRNFYPKGSLKDFIHKSNPKDRYADKYNSEYQMNDKLIAKFGRQILEGLAYFKFQNIPFYHLHSGNVLIDEGNCYISEYESVFLGLRPQLAPFMKALWEKVDPDVVCFGCVLFEMAVGYELETADAIQLGIPPNCPPSIRSVLEAIFQPWYGKPPSVEDLLMMDVFVNTKIKKPAYRRNAYTVKEKEMLAAAKQLTTSLIVSETFNPKDFTFKALQKKKRVINTASNDSPAPSSYSSPATAPQASVSTPTSAPPPPPPQKSAAPGPPPPPPPKAAPGPPPPPPPASKAPAERNQLLGSITGFNSAKLKKTKTVDKSSPILKKA